MSMALLAPLFPKHCSMQHTKFQKTVTGPVEEANAMDLLYETARNSKLSWNIAIGLPSFDLQHHNPITQHLSTFLLPGRWSYK